MGVVAAQEQAVRDANKEAAAVLGYNFPGSEWYERS